MTQAYDEHASGGSMQAMLAIALDFFMCDHALSGLVTPVQVPGLVITFFRDGEGRQRQSRCLSGQHTLCSDHCGHAPSPGVVGHHLPFGPRSNGHKASH